MSERARQVALVAMHTSPAEQPGRGDSGGLNVSVLAQAHALAALGCDVEILTRANGPQQTTELADGVVLRALQAGPSGPVPKSALVGLTDAFGEAVASAARQRPAGYDLIHAHYWLSGLAALPVSLELGIPLVHTFHTLAVMKNQHRGPGQALEPRHRLRTENYLAAEASAVVAVSGAEATCLLDEVGCAAERLWVVPPGVDVHLFRPRDAATHERVRRRHRIPAGSPIIALVGRIQPLKGHELAVRMLGELVSRGSITPTVVVVGEATPGDEDFLDQLGTLARNLGVATEVRLVGALAREDLAELFSAAAVTVVPSLSETFGLVAVESAACGTPVIGYHSTGLVESVGPAGVLLSSRDPSEWAAAVAALLDAPDELARAGQEARAHAARFSWENNARALIDVYDSCGSSVR